MAKYKVILTLKDVFPVVTLNRVPKIEKGVFLPHREVNGVT